MKIKLKFLALTRSKNWNILVGFLFGKDKYERERERERERVRERKRERENEREREIVWLRDYYSLANISIGTRLLLRGRINGMLHSYITDLNASSLDYFLSFLSHTFFFQKA